MPATPAALQRLEALETHALAARCLAGIGQLSESILGPRARHEELQRSLEVEFAMRARVNLRQHFNQLGYTLAGCHLPEGECLRP